MATGLQAPGVPSAVDAQHAFDRALSDAVWQAPLVPVALAFTAGIVLDRYAEPPLVFSLVGVLVCLIAWAVTRNRRPAGLPLAYLFTAVAALGTAYHHWYEAEYAPDDIGNYATEEPRPVHLYGELAEEPTVAWHPHEEPLQTFRRSGPTVAVLRVLYRKQHDDWQPVSGRARLVVAEPVEGLHAGDKVEVFGRLQAPAGPSNPGEADYAANLRDQRIRAVVLVQKTAQAVGRLEEGWRSSLAGWLAVVRGRGQRVLKEALPEESSGVAAALLLGETTAMTRDDWDRYIRTGVVHVLAVSGQHLVVLAAFLWIVFRVLGVRRRHGAWLVALLLVAYALLAGGRPPVVRSAVMVCAYCAGIFLRRPVLLANSFALAWILVAALNPADLFNTGCQLSFLSVAVLYWGAAPLLDSRPGALFGSKADPLEQLVDESRPVWLRLLRGVGRAVLVSYLTTWMVCLALAPLLAARYHLLGPAALIIGPPVVFFASVALIAGFLLLFASAVCWPLVPLFAWVTKAGLAGCEFLVNAGDRAGAIWYVGEVPDWWLWALYPALLVVLVTRPLRRHWRWTGSAGLGWLCVGLAAAAVRPAADEMRCTFLAVGHGGCIVIETPEGRTLLYDAGAIAGPDVTRRVIAPFLWSRGVRRIDEVFLSHADLDHFNGVVSLLDRFKIAQVTHTPSFPDRSLTGVRVTLNTLQEHKVPLRKVQAGDRLRSGSVEMEVLHPPDEGPAGPENARSLVLSVRHAGHTILLTGDLEKAGLDRVLTLPRPPVDVLMAPHHGSRTANTPALAEWARPRVVVSCQGPPRGYARQQEPYTAAGATFLGTWPHGAVTVRSARGGLVAETYRTGQRIVVRGSGG